VSEREGWVTASVRDTITSGRVEFNYWDDEGWLVTEVTVDGELMRIVKMNPEGLTARTEDCDE